MSRDVELTADYSELINRLKKKIIFSVGSNQVVEGDWYLVEEANRVAVECVKMTLDDVQEFRQNGFLVTPVHILRKEPLNAENSNDNRG